MKIDLLLAGCPLGRVAETARRAEAAGYDGIFVPEAVNEPFLTAAVGLEATSRIEMGPAIALAFVRSPMVTAMAAWELQAMSGGRFRLGLGPQVKAHNERRFSVPYEKPAAKLAEQVRALRAIWAAFAGEAPLDFHGEFYRFDLLTEFFNPGPIDAPPPPVYLAAVNPYSFRMAGEVADGVHVHPLHTVRYLTEVAYPALDEGLARSGRRREDIDLSAQVMVVAGEGEEGRRMHEAVRAQIAFYGSTRTYKAPLELAGYGDLNAELHRLMATGDREALLAAVPDELVDEFAVRGDTWEDVAANARKRYDGIVDRISLYFLPPLDDPEASRVPAAFHG
ncbi:MAG: TIGR03617 family F420-dependent LLM class oxidoreductase [Actinomycetota bacterium]|jgi:probable F420-dependent oxidoreductase